MSIPLLQKYIRVNYSGRLASKKTADGLELYSIGGDSRCLLKDMKSHFNIYPITEFEIEVDKEFQYEHVLSFIDSFSMIGIPRQENEQESEEEVWEEDWDDDSIIGGE